jgi:hydrogenase maturation protease
VNPVLIAGIGNIFHGDDGFGVAVAQQLARAPRPDGVDVVDFGIRGLDLAYALTGGYRLAVLVDTVQRGGAPGTLHLIEPTPDAFDEAEAGLSPHRIDPASVLRMTRLLGGPCAEVLLVGCEPGSFGDPEFGHIGLGEAVTAAIDAAAARAVAAATAWLAKDLSSAIDRRIPEESFHA